MKCPWCNQGGDELIDVTLDSSNRFARKPQPRTFTVHPRHEGALRAFHRQVERHGKHFVIAILSLLAAVVAIEVVSLAAGRFGLGLLAVGAAVAAMGGVMIAWPFATPETVRLIGLRAAIRLTRGAGAVTVIVGLVVALLGLRQLG